MAWAYMAANGPGSLVFIDDVTGDRSSRMNSEVFKAMLTFSQILQTDRTQLHSANSYRVTVFHHFGEYPRT